MISPLLFVIHPVTIVLLLLCVAMQMRHKLSFQWHGGVIIAIAAMLKPLIWWYVLPALFGWHLSELGGCLYMYFILPINGAVSGGLLALCAWYRKKKTVVIVLFKVLFLLFSFLVELLILGSNNYFYSNLH